MGYVDGDGYMYLTERSTFIVVCSGWGQHLTRRRRRPARSCHPKLVDAAVFGVPNEEFRSEERFKAVVQTVGGVTPGPTRVRVTSTAEPTSPANKCTRKVDSTPKLSPGPDGNAV